MMRYGKPVALKHSKKRAKYRPAVIRIPKSKMPGFYNRKRENA